MHIYSHFDICLFPHVVKLPKLGIYIIIFFNSSFYGFCWMFAFMFRKSNLKKKKKEI